MKTWEGNRSQRNRLKKRLALGFAVSSAIPSITQAGTGHLWFANSDNWSMATNWTALPPAAGSGVPVSGDDAYLTQLDAVTRVVNFDGNYLSPALLNSLTIDATGLGTMTLSQSVNRLRSDSEYIGDAGVGSYSQSGGANDANLLLLGSGITGNGNYGLSNSASLNIGVGMYVGYLGTGTMNQTGGAVTVAAGAELVLGYFGGSTGTYNFSGGTITTPGLRIGDDAGASGQFIHSGGTATISTDLEIASSTTSSLGSYSISNGTLNVGRNLIIGEAGTGQFTQTGGLVQVTGGGSNGVMIGLSPISGTSAASIGSYTLSGTGLLSVTGRVYVGFAGNGTFTQTGGTSNINGALVIASTGSNTSSADYFLQGGALNVLGTGVIQLNTGGSFSQTGGTLTYSAFNMDGGTVNGTLTNGGTFNYTAGNFTGRLVNAVGSAANFNADFTAGNGMANATLLSFDPSRTITLNGAGLNNTGTMQLQGGVLNGSGPMLNNGTLSGSGTIGGSGGFTNAANWSVGPSNLSFTRTGGNVNSGTLDIAASVAGISLGLDDASVRLDNTGTINLNTNAQISGPGTLLNKLGGVINAGSGATISSVFANQGNINIGISGTGDLTILQPFTNSGGISLQNHSLSGGKITNLGAINGPGQIDNDIDNSGTIDQSAAGTLGINGALSTTASSIISVNTGATIASNLLNNAGSITIKPGGTFSAGTFPNTGLIVNSGTLDTTGITNTGTISYRGASSIDSFGPITNNAGGAISLDATGAPSVFFYDDLTHKPGASFTVAAGATANFLGNVTGGGDINNSGALNFSGGKTYALGTISGSGSTVLFEGATLSAKRITQSGLTLNSSGTSVAVVSITPAASAGTSTSKVNTLSIAGDSTPTARLDLSNTNLIVDYTGASPLSTIRAQIRSGFNAPGTPWTGNGITSSTAAAGGGTALGYAEASTALALSGSNTANWFGQTADATSVLIRFTKAGDTNLDGSVGFADLVSVAQHYGDSSGNRLWSEGDVNYDGNVGFADLVIIAQNYGSALPSLPVGADYPGGFAAAYAAAQAAVPEPGTISLLGATGLLLARRRRRI